MIALILATSLILSGISSQYAGGVMEGVIAYRQNNPTAYPLPEKLPEVDGYLATRDCHHIGEVVYVLHNGNLEKFLVVDCASGADGTIPWMNRNGIVIEVDHNTAVRWGTVGRGCNVIVFIPQWKEVMN